MSIHHLHRMAVFAKVIEKGSFSEAAKILGLGKSAVSQHVSALEEALGVKLLNRSTRSLSLTQEGREYHASCARIVAEAELAQQVLDNSSESERGTVRLTCSYNLGINFVVPLLGEFRRTHPDIEIDLILDDRVLNMVDEGIDVSLRTGWLTDSSYYTVTLAPMCMIVCARRDYAEIHGPFEDPGLLALHNWIAISGVQHPERIALETDDGQRITVANLRTAIRVNSGLAARSLILSGAGIGMLPDYAAYDLLMDAQLVRLCPAWRSKPGTISAVFASRHHMTKRSRALIDFLKEQMPAQLNHPVTQ